VDVAVQAGQARAAGSLLKRSALPGPKLAGLLSKSVLKGDSAMVDVLLDAGAPAGGRNAAGSTALHDAALKGYREVAASLLAHGADVNERNQYGARPLHDAALSGHADVVALLLDHGAEINAREEDSGATPLYTAASMGRMAAVKVLLDHAADPNVSSKTGHTARFAAAQNGFDAVAEYLGEHGAHN
jgi:ankyrin repeat protein